MYQIVHTKLASVNVKCLLIWEQTQTLVYPILRCSVKDTVIIAICFIVCTYIPGAVWSYSGQPIPRVEYTEEEVKTWWVWNTYMRSVLGMEWPLGIVQVLPFWCLVLYSLAILLLLRCKWCCVALWLVANACMLAPTEERGRQMLPPPTLNCVCMYVYAITNTTEHTQVVTAQS